MSNKRLFQLIAAVEEQPGVVTPNLVSLANAKILVSDPQMVLETQAYDRQINRESLTPLTPLQGSVEGSLTFTVEMAGTTGSGTAPDWSLLLRACGLREREFGYVDISSQSGNAFYSGETVSGASSGSLEVVHDTWNGATRMFGTEQTGPVGNLTGATSGATANNDGTAVRHGWCWTPRSRPVVDIAGTLPTGVTLSAGDILIGQTGGTVLQVINAEDTGTEIECYILNPGNFLSPGEVLADVNGVTQLTLDGTGSLISQQEVPSLSLAVIEDGVIRVLRGCRGSVEFSASIGEPMLMNFTFRGLHSSIYDGQLSGTPTPTAKTPPVFLDVAYGVGKDSPVVAPSALHEACITNFGVNFQNDLAIEKCAGSANGTRGSAMLVGRTVTGSIDPSVNPEASFPWLEVFRAGTIFRQRLTIGDTAANQFHLSLPACRITSEGGGDRDGIATRDLQFSCSGRSEDGVDRSDRELVLTYHQDSTYSD